MDAIAGRAADGGWFFSQQPAAAMTDAATAGVRSAA